MYKLQKRRKTQDNWNSMINPRASPLSKCLPRTIKPIKKQSGYRKSYWKDQWTKAMRPGKRISRTGNIYWETRKNRSDINKQL